MCGYYKVRACDHNNVPYSLKELIMKNSNYQMLESAIWDFADEVEKDWLNSPSKRPDGPRSGISRFELQ